MRFYNLPHAGRAYPHGKSMFLMRYNSVPKMVRKTSTHRIATWSTGLMLNSALTYPKCLLSAVRWWHTRRRNLA